MRRPLPRQTWCTLLASASAAALCLPCPAEAAPRAPAKAARPASAVKLRLRMRPHDLYVTRVVVTGRGQGLVTGGKSSPLDFRLTAEHERWVERVLPNGNAVVQDRVRGGEVVLNNIPQPLPTGERVTLEITPLGKITRVDEGKVSIARAKVESNFSPGTLTELLAFPAAAVRPGHSWQASLPIRIPGLATASLHLRSAYKGTSVVAGTRCAGVSTAMQLPFQVDVADPRQMKVQVKGKAFGQMVTYSSLETGVPVRSRGKLRLTVSGYTYGNRNPAFPISGLANLRVTVSSDLISYVPGSTGPVSTASASGTLAPMTPPTGGIDLSSTAPSGGASQGKPTNLFGAIDLARSLGGQLSGRDTGAPSEASDSAGAAADPGASAASPSTPSPAEPAGPTQAPGAPDDASDEAAPAAPPDPVRLLNLEDGRMVFGVTTLCAAVSDPSSKPFVVFVVDGETQHLTNRQPYGFRWDTRGLKDGLHEVSVWLLGKGGKVLHRSPAVTVEVRNEVQGPPLPADRVAAS